MCAVTVPSAAWASTIDLDSPGGQAHAYYGTDVRMQALALGVAAGVWTGHRGRGGGLLRARDRRDPLDAGDRRLEILGWVAVAGIERLLKAKTAYEKINYLMLMMVDPDVHFHVIPRYSGEREFGGLAFPDAGWPGPPNLGAAVDPGPEGLRALVEALREAWADPAE